MLTKLLDNIQKKQTIDNGVFSSKILGYGFSQNISWNWLTPYVAWRYYNNVSPVADACNIIAQEFANIPIAIQNKKTKEFIKEPDSSIPASNVLKLFNNPSTNISGSELQKQIALSFVVTGNNYLVVNARDKVSEPLELFYIKPQSVTISRSGDLTHMYTTEEDFSVNFNNTLTDPRLYDKSGSFEITHIRNFNSDFGVNQPYGRSPLNAIFYEIEQHLNGNIHNNSLLKNGARPSGVITSDPESTFNLFDDDNYEKIKSEIRNYYQGSGNVGNVLILDGAKEFKELSINNKDMDFKELKNQVSQQIYANLNIPKPLVDSNTMTYSNFKEALFMLYYLNIIPISNLIFEKLTNFLMPRYKDGDKYEITFDVRDIPALQVVQDEQLERLYKLGILNLNEARELADYQEIGEDGDTFFIQNSLVPINVAKDTTQESKNYFYKQLEQKGYKKSDIENLWSNYGNKL